MTASRTASPARLAAAMSRMDVAATGRRLAGSTASASKSTSTGDAAAPRQGADTTAPWHELPDGVRDMILGMLPPALLARIPAHPALHARALADVVGRRDAADGIANPRRALLATCRLLTAPELQVTRMKMPQPPADWVEPEPDEAAVHNGTFPASWGTVRPGMATWGTKLAFPIHNNPKKLEPGQEYGHHVGVAVLDVVSEKWTQLYDLGCTALALGPEGIFTFGRGRLVLTDYDGRKVWNVDAHWPFEHIALGGSEVLGVCSEGASLRFDRATGAWLTQAGVPDVAETIRVSGVWPSPTGFLASTIGGHVLAWPRDEAETAPTCRLAAQGWVKSVEVNDHSLAAVHLDPSGETSTELSIRSGNSLAVPAALSWPAQQCKTRSLQLVGQTLFWRSQPRGGDGATLLRAHPSNRVAQEVATLPLTVVGSAVVFGGYYTFDNNDYRTLMKVAPPGW